ncbi:hypothetical protein NL676_010877 [Syzygium grande]|nr:hypothetical protein NL676_010877 [Syzygium grande]
MSQQIHFIPRSWLCSIYPGVGFWRTGEDGVNLRWQPSLKFSTSLKCEYLRRTPDLSAFNSLEMLNLEDCKNLEEIHSSIGDIKTLVTLNVGQCHRLKELPAREGRMKELRELILDETAIQEIPISRDCLMKLETLSAS